MSLLTAAACGGLVVLVLVVGVGMAIQRTGDRWREYGEHRRATPVMRRRAMRETGNNVQVFLLAVGIVVVAVAILITDK